jgi:hypothetical protein
MKAEGRRQEAGFWRKLELPPKTFPIKRGGLYQVGFDHLQQLAFLHFYVQIKRGTKCVVSIIYTFQTSFDSGKGVTCSDALGTGIFGLSYFFWVCGWFLIWFPTSQQRYCGFWKWIICLFFGYG